jgi:hypothetical protein
LLFEYVTTIIINNDMIFAFHCINWTNHKSKHMVRKIKFIY